MSGGQGITQEQHAQVRLAYVAFVLIGISAAVGGVLLPDQIKDYGLDKATFGFVFFASSAGFLLAGSAAGAIINRIGVRATLGVGGAAYVLAAFGTGTQPPFTVLLALQVAAGFGTGVMESVLNVHLAGLPDSAGPLNRLHAFFGVGALIGPTFAAWMLRGAPWTAVWLALGGLGLLLLIAYLRVFPRRAAPDQDGVRRAAPGEAEPGGIGLFTALRQPAVLLGAVFLSVYVGLEIAVGSWAFTFLVEERAQAELIAGYAITGYWLGLTVGRFVLNPIADRIGLTSVGLTFACLGGVAAGSLMVWLAPVGSVAVIGLFVIGFFLGPIFPTTIVVVPKLTPPHLVPTAVGAMVGMSVIGGALFPWLAGGMAQRIGVWTLLPYAAALAVSLVAVWWLIARRIPRSPAEETSGSAAEDLDPV